ncbi:MAG: AEC family transporter [Firmicutes bacterium]|nr:AEC family transporter [Bacillota bacterium]
MDLAIIAAKQVAVLFVLIFSGFICVKANILKTEAKKHFSDLLIYLIIPAMIINSYLTEFKPEILSNLLQAFVLGTVLVLLGLIVTLICSLKIKDKNAPIIKFTCTFSNAAYMGFPLIEALFGSEGLIYASAFVTVYNILLWTIGIAILTKKTDIKEVAKSILSTPVLFAVLIGLALFLLRVKVPEIIQKPINNIGSMNTALSMIITGILIASAKFKDIVANKLLLFVIGVRIFLIPLTCLALFKALSLSGTVPAIVLMLESCPCASITSVFAVKYGYSENLAAGCVIVTTFLSMLTLPLMAYIITL